MSTDKEMFLAMQSIENLDIEEMEFCVEPTLLKETVDFSIEESVMLIFGNMGLADQKVLTFSITYQFHDLDVEFSLEHDNGQCSCTLSASGTHKISVESRNGLVEQVELCALRPELPSYTISREPHLAIPTRVALVT